MHLKKQIKSKSIRFRENVLEEMRYYEISKVTILRSHPATETGVTTIYFQTLISPT